MKTTHTPTEEMNILEQILDVQLKTRALKTVEEKDKQLASCYDRMNRAETDRDRLLADNQALRDDAMRYRWLRDEHWTRDTNPKVWLAISQAWEGEKLDSAIDEAALAKASHD